MPPQINRASPSNISKIGRTTAVDGKRVVRDFQSRVPLGSRWLGTTDCDQGTLKSTFVNALKLMHF